MSLLSRKKEINIEEFCRRFYDDIYLNPTAGEIEVGNSLYETLMRQVTEVDPNFTKVSLEKFASEIRILQFELFSLAWIHKFISGKTVISQSVFTKSYLHEKGRDDIWKGMDDYTKIIDGGTLRWLTSLGKMNLGFNYNMREELTAKNNEETKILGIDSKDVIERVNYRLLSENAWKQKILIAPLVGKLCDRLNINSAELNDDAQLNLSYIIRMIYDGARQSLDRIKIKN